MGFWQFLNQWWNLPYLVLLGLVGVYFALQTVGLIGAIGHDHDADADADADTDADTDAGTDADTDVHADAEAGHEVEHDHEVDHEHEQEQEHEVEDGHAAAKGEASGAGSIAGFLGVGRVPFMVVWLTLFIFAGFTGLIANLLLLSLGPYRGWWFPLSALAALVVGLTATRVTARAVHRLVDVGGRGAARKHELAGAVGTVASPVVDAQFGEIRVRDGRGQEILVHGRVEEGEPQLRQGEPVVLVEYDAAQGLFSVAPLEKRPGPEPLAGAARGTEQDEVVAGAATREKGRTT